MTKNLKIILNYYLGPLIFVFLSFSLYRQIAHRPNLEIQWNLIKASTTTVKLWGIVFLMFLNWGIEAKKWQLLINHIQQFSFYRAFKSVLAGCSITMLTPNRIGEFGGRIIYVENLNRIKAVSLTIVGSISQLLVTLLMGCMGLVYFKYFSTNDDNILGVLPHFWQSFILSISVGVTLVVLLFYLRLGWLVKLLEKLPALQNFIQHINVLQEFNNMQLIQILSLSCIRYLVFVLQYVLLLQVMDVQIAGLLSFMLITIFYLFMAVVPTFGFIELPVRVSASWAILKLYTVNELGVGSVALGIWIINLVIPALIGSLLILSNKIVREK